MSTATLARFDSARFQDLVALAQRQPMLSETEERDLVARWRRGDERAGERVVNAHLRLVARMARDYAGYGIPLEDLFSQGVLGLLQALRRFDPDRGVRFSSYAMMWIRSAITEYVMHAWSVVKLGTTPAQKKLFHNLARMRRELRALDGQLSAEQIQTIAQALDVPEAEVRETDRRLAARDASLDAPVHGGAEDDGTEWLDRLVDTDPSPESTVADAEERALRRRLLEAALDTLDVRQRDIIAARCLSDPPATLETLARHYGVSCERIRQIEAQAIAKLRRHVRAAMATFGPRPDDARASAMAASAAAA